MAEHWVQHYSVLDSAGRKANYTPITDGGQAIREAARLDSVDPDCAPHRAALVLPYDQLGEPSPSELSQRTDPVLVAISVAATGPRTIRWSGSL